MRGRGKGGAWATGGVTVEWARWWEQQRQSHGHSRLLAPSAGCVPQRYRRVLWCSSSVSYSRENNRLGERDLV